MSKNLINDIDKYQEVKSSETFKKKPKNLKKKHQKRIRPIEEVEEDFEELEF